MGSTEQSEKSGVKQYLRENWWKLLILVAYCGLLAYMISVHEPWGDELQAWTMARDTNPVSLLFTHLRYEGHPGLWPLILMAPAKLGLPPFTMNLISAVIALASVYLLLFRSRFPAVLKVLLPFSYFLFYQYAVVARNYCLITLLLFLVAMYYTRRTDRFYTFVLLLCLLANTSAHGALLAISLLFVHWVDLRKVWGSLDAGARRKQLIGTGVFVLVIALVVIMLWPPGDLVTPGQSASDAGEALRVGARVLNHSLTGIWWLSLAALLLICIWLFRQRLLFLYLACIVPLLLFFAFFVVRLWHEGIPFLVLVMCMWLGFEEETEAKARHWSRPRADTLLRYAAVAAMVLILLFGVKWSYGAFRNDSQRVYSTAFITADYIARNGLEGKRIAMIGNQTAVNAFFDGNIFYNHNDGRRPSFWEYSTANEDILAPGRQDLERLLDTKPDYIIVPYEFGGQSDLTGYRPVMIFWSMTLWKDTFRLPGPDALVIYKRE
ncbi:MAG: hypothetical protein KKF41_14025 [Actinobacteria bacterium]|nr:hypothetical protein [Actinomycetota bacterium]MBU1942633.1 hypothetical protein [Actinomycetota bacterium]MBU2688691.1 hypothetical protein [Actinomycetota bacterium]